MAVKLQRRAISVAEYHKMREAGILGEDEQVELLNGELINMSPKGCKHAAYLGVFMDLLFPLIPEYSALRVQDPVVLSDYSEPEPDLAIVKRRKDFYVNAHPSGPDIYLIIEIADKSLSFDREYKRKYYAESSIPEYWIINIQDEEIEIFKEPADGDYKSKEVIKRGDNVSIEIMGISFNSNSVFSV